MAQPDLENHTPFPAMVVRKYGYRLRPFDVLVVRGSFDLQPGFRATPCDEQARLVMADKYAAEPPEKSYLLAETDLVIAKKHTDVVVKAKAYAPEGKPAAEFGAALQVGPVQKTFAVTGPRRWEQRARRWRLSEPSPVFEVPLTYDLAYGGSYSLTDSEGMPSLGSDNLLAYPANGAGRGWLPNAAEIRERFGDRMKETEAADWARALELFWTRAGGMPAHQIEDPRRRMESIDERPDPQGALPVARFWRQRARFAGTYDDTWLREIWPSVPDDFDFRFYQSAHPDLVADGYLSGDEVFATVNLTPEGELRGRLPAFEPFVLASDAHGIADKLDLRLDTVCFDLEERKLFLTWRYSFAEELGYRRLLLATLVPPPEKRGETLVQLRRSGGAHG